MRFDNRVALITAAASGIGRATADIIAAEGGIVVAVDMDQARLDTMAAAIRAAGGRVHRRRADALDAAPSLTLTERIRPHWDRRSADERAREVARTPLRRVAEAADQARVVCFLASRDADVVTGVTIDVTGGV